MRTDYDYTPGKPCPMSGRRSTNWPGTHDSCEGCGRVVLTRSRDNTYSKHNVPTDRYWKAQDDYADYLANDEA